MKFSTHIIMSLGVLATHSVVSVIGSRFKKEQRPVLRKLSESERVIVPVPPDKVPELPTDADLLNWAGIKRFHVLDKWYLSIPVPPTVSAARTLLGLPFRGHGALHPQSDDHKRHLQTLDMFGNDEVVSIVRSVDLADTYSGEATLLFDLLESSLLDSSGTFVSDMIAVAYGQPNTNRPSGFRGGRRKLAYTPDQVWAFNWIYEDATLNDCMSETRKQGTRFNSPADAGAGTVVFVTDTGERASTIFIHYQ